MVVYTKPEYMKDKTVDLNDKKNKKGKKGQCRNCPHNIEIFWEKDWEMRSDEKIPTYITLDGVTIQSHIITYRAEMRLKKSMHRLRKIMIVQGAAILILALTQLLR